MTDQQRAAVGRGPGPGHGPGAGQGSAARGEARAPGDATVRQDAAVRESRAEDGDAGVHRNEEDFGGAPVHNEHDRGGTGAPQGPGRSEPGDAPTGTAARDRADGGGPSRGPVGPGRPGAPEGGRGPGGLGAPGSASGAGRGPGSPSGPGEGGGGPVGGGDGPRREDGPEGDGPGAVRGHGRFRRDRQYKMLGGVCSGLARQCDMDPVIFRIVLAVLSATGGLGLIFYGFVWLLVPYEDEEENEIRKLLTGRVDGQGLAAVLFALVGCGVFLSMLRNGGVLTFAAILSLLLAGAGFWSRQRGATDPDPLAAQAVADAPPEATAPPVAASYPSWWRDPIVKDGTHVGGTGYLWGPSDTPGRDIAAAVDSPRGSSYAQQTRDADRPRLPGPRWIGGWVFLLALLAGGLGTGLTWDGQALGTSLQTGLASALAVFGVGIAISSFLGRTGAGSIFIAIVTAGLLAASVALPKDISTHWTRTTWTPASAAAVREKYDLGTGVGTLDLSRLRLAKGETVTTRAEVGVGQLKVVVPKDVAVALKIDTGIGDIQLPGESEKDVDVEPGRHKQVTLDPVPGTKKAATLRLGLKVGVGQVEVTRAAS